MSKALIVGFVNRMRCLPVGLMAVVRMPDGFYARWPHPNPMENFLKILDVNTEEELQKFFSENDNAWADNTGKTLDIERNEFAYAFSMDEIFIGTIEEMICEVRRRLQIKGLHQQTLKGLNDALREIQEDPVLCCYL